MSLDKAKAFLDKVATDRKLRSQVQVSGQKVLNEIIAVANKNGFDCTAVELQNALREKFGATNIPAAKRDDEAICIALVLR